MYHYTYILTDGERYYIGVRQCKCLPWDDISYWGSATDKSFKPHTKKFLSFHYTREDALLAEIYWHELFDVARNPLFANRAKQTSTGFDTAGLSMPKSEEHRKKLSKALTGKNNWMFGRYGAANHRQGIAHTEDARRKISERLKGKKHSAERRKRKSERQMGKANTNYGKPSVNRDPHIYMFCNRLTGEKFMGQRADFVKKYSLAENHVGMVCRGEKRSVKNWICLCLL